DHVRRRRRNAARAPRRRGFLHPGARGAGSLARAGTPGALRRALHRGGAAAARRTRLGGRATARQEEGIVSGISAPPSRSRAAPAACPEPAEGPFGTANTTMLVASCPAAIGSPSGTTPAARATAAEASAATTSRPAPSTR